MKNRLAYLNIWSLVGSAVWEVMEPLGGGPLLEEVSLGVGVLEF